MRRYLADAGALARKALLLEVRARDTLPAMLLFVIAVLVVFHFALPTNASADASLGLLWVAILFTALLGLGRSFVAEREQGVLDGLVLAPSDRSAIWVGKVVATLAFLVVAEVVALPAFALFFTSIDASTIAGVALADVGICAVGTVLAAMAAAGRARSRSSSEASARASPTPAASISPSWRSTTRSSCSLPGRRSSTSLRSNRHRGVACDAAQEAAPTCAARPLNPVGGRLAASSSREQAKERRARCARRADVARGRPARA